MKVVLALLFCFGNILAQVPSYVPTNGLIGWWGFNGNANDGSGNGYNGTVYGATLTTNRINTANSAYNFDGIDDYIQTSLPYTVFLNKKTLTISAWINLGSNTSFYGYSVVSNLIPSNTQSLFILAGTETSTQHRKLCFAYIADGGTMTPYVSTGNAIQTNVWKHIVVVLDNGSLRYFIDGALASTHTVPTNGISSEGVSQNYRFGRGNPTPGFRQDFVGKIDDIGIWNRALTQTEIDNLSQVDLPISATASTVTNVSCFDGNNGSVTVSTPTGGTSPYTYSWNTVPVQTTQTATGLKAGTYTVTVTDSKGSQTTANATVTQPPVISNVVTSIVSNISCFAGSDGSVTVSTPTGGTPPYTYSWNTNPVKTTQTAQNIAAGTYTVTVTDSKGCTKTSNVSITQPPAITNVLASTLKNVGCFGGSNGSVTVTTPTGGTPPYTFVWNSTPVQVTQTATNLPIGTYTVTITDTKGCIVTSSTSITQPTQPLSNVVAQTTQNVKCHGTSTGIITVSNPVGGTPPYSYKWNTSPEQRTQIATNVPTGLYTVTVTDSNGCTATSIATVTEPAKITNVQTSIIKNVQCFGQSNGSAKVSDPRGGTPPYTYEWNSVPKQTSQTATYLRAGDYLVTVIDANGCTVQAQATITQPNEIPAPTITGEQNICLSSSPSTFTVNQIPGYSIEWEKPRLGSIVSYKLNAVSIIWNSSGTDSVRVKIKDNVSGCERDTILRVIILKSPEPLITGDARACENQAPKVYRVQKQSGRTYTWSKPKNGIIVGSTTSDSISVQWVNSGSDTLRMEERDNATNCTKDNSFIVSIAPLPDATISGSNQVRENEQGITYSVKNESGLSYDWTIVSGDATIAGKTGNSVTLNAGRPGSVKLNVKVTNQNGCMSESELSITVKSLTSIKETSSAPFTLYPNPAGDHLYVKMDAEITGDIDIELYDVLGNRHFKQTYQLTEIIRIPVQSLSQGMYLIKVKTSLDEYMERFVK